MKEFVNQNPRGVLGAVHKDAGGVTRIGVAAVNVEGLDGLPCSFGKGAEGGMGAEINGIGESIGPLEELKNARPQGPGHVGCLFGRVEKGDDCAALCLPHVGLNAPGIPGLIVMCARLDLVKLGRSGTFARKDCFAGLVKRGRDPRL